MTAEQTVELIAIAKNVQLALYILAAVAVLRLLATKL